MFCNLVSGNMKMPLSFTRSCYVIFDYFHLSFSFYTSVQQGILQNDIVSFNARSNKKLNAAPAIFFK
jgi:hypothetical protein